MDYCKDPQAIYCASYRQVYAAVSALIPQPGRVLLRMVHACADPSIANDFRHSIDAEALGSAALHAGAPILCDCEMVRHGVIKHRLPADNRLICMLNDHNTTTLAKQHDTTRSAAAVLQWLPWLEGSIVVIGNAPTALFQLLECLADGAPHPALIIGMPVGFIGATESKQALINQAGDIPYLSLLGRKGGSAMAAAALNSLIGDFSNN